MLEARSRRILMRTIRATLVAVPFVGLAVVVGLLSLLIGLAR
jgi:hypothetical protein